MHLRNGAVTVAAYILDRQTGKLDAGQLRLSATAGRNYMPTFKDVYDLNQMRDVSEYITSVLPNETGASK